VSAGRVRGGGSGAGSGGGQGKGGWGPALAARLACALLAVWMGIAQAWPSQAWPALSWPIEPQWSTTEVHYQRGSLYAPHFAGGGRVPTNILTVQHASGYAYGDVFFFVDLFDTDRPGAFNDQDVYGEVYGFLMASRVTGRSFAWGPIKDLGVGGGINADRKAEVYKYLPGVRIAWDLPGVKFLNLDLMAFLEDSVGVARGGAPKEGNGFDFDLNGAYPFTSAGESFSIEGHVEYFGGRGRNELGRVTPDAILAQPQFRYDLGKGVTGVANKFFVGVEWQIWYHKLGDSHTFESAPQLLAVWRF
jgi:nucleoside-specific outer membrane channel protein Tsx